MTDRACRAYVRFDGQRPPEQVMAALQSVEVHEIVAGRPAMTSEIVLRFADPTYALVDAELFRAGTAVDVSISVSGEPQDAVHVGHAEIVKVEPAFGGGELTVTARDASDPARAGTRVKAWGRRSDAERVRAIAQLRGWSTTIGGKSTVGKAGGSVARDQSAADMPYLAELAELYGYDTAVLWDERARRWALWWGPRYSRPDASVEYRFHAAGVPADRQILEFRPIVLSAAQAPTEVRVTGYSAIDRKTIEAVVVKQVTRDPKTGKLSVGTKTIERVRSVTVGAKLRLDIGGEAVVVHSGRVIRSQAQAQEFAANWLAERAAAFVTGSATFLGDPTLRAGQTHRLRFFGEGDHGQEREIARFSGDYWLSSVRHIFGDTYTVEAGVRLLGDR